MIIKYLHERGLRGWKKDKTYPCGVYKTHTLEMADSGAVRDMLSIIISISKWRNQGQRGSSNLNSFLGAGRGTQDGSQGSIS